MIEVRNLTKRFGGSTAVDDLSFTVRPGVVTGFLGPNGAGKSTTMRMIVGLDTPSSGEALIDGRPYRALENPTHTVGCLLDASWTHANRSAGAHLRMIAAAGGLPASRVDEVLGLVGLADVAGRKVGGYSLGMRQRLGLATAMLGDPQVLLFDEPVNGLDPEGILWIRRFMHARAAEGRTVLVSSHLLSEMSQTAQDLVVIGRGRLRAQTSVEDFLSAAVSTVVLRTPHVDEFAAAAREEGVAATFDTPTGLFTIEGLRAPQVGDLAASLGITVHELHEKRASLEEAFMALTDQDVEYHGQETTR
ncbi:ABC transporter ATP-binding protein [uncultured Dietzia sp.]|uniref:ABC transporter ATP-binding protein n=1 Tax=uncultured Dietzia sp. TaxID=395519 RepID=UPI002615C86F|nr:ABC transporter ATP-binding protein [uncultured Dietzia sp.]